MENNLESRPSTRTPIEKTDDLDILSAIWILSCNDENPILTYKGITSRLDLPESFDIKSLIRSRSELFRPKVSRSRLEEWREIMRGGQKRPAWITEMKNEVDRNKAIESLTRDDVFRNQFRAGAGARKCDIKIIDWGLNHIERLRKSAADEREEKSRKISTVIIPLVSLFVALVSIIISGGVQWISIGAQKEMKQYEVSFKPKQEGYSSFMAALTKAAIAADNRSQENTVAEINRMELAYYYFEPFLPANKRDGLLRKYGEFIALCIQRIASAPVEGEAQKKSYQEFAKKLGDLKLYFHTELSKDLFE